MNAPETIELSQDGALATITLNRPDKMNSLSFQLIGEVVDALEACRADDSVRAVLLNAAGERAFCAGYDLTGLGEPVDPPTANGHLRSTYRVERIENAITSLPKPVVAAVRGHAIGSGLDVVLSCDYVVVSETARLCESRVRRANMTTTHWLPTYVGWAKAKDMILRGTVVPGEEAERIGLVNECVPDGELDQRSREVAAEFAAGPTIALGFYKQALYSQIRSTLTSGQQERNSYGTILGQTDDIKEARSAFREKRKPSFTGR
jgi:2-(1,2-epoxy-1,2-dihydrophenyl)acetyl-CoA isomerase